MPDAAWKKSERALAEVLRPLFPEAIRNPLSGGEDTGTKADVKNTGDLFVEAKKSSRVPFLAAFLTAKAKARKEGKRLTVVVFQRNRSPTRMALVDLDEWVDFAVVERALHMLSLDELVAALLVHIEDVIEQKGDIPLSVYKEDLAKEIRLRRHPAPDMPESVAEKVQAFQKALREGL